MLGGVVAGCRLVSDSVGFFLAVGVEWVLRPLVSYRTYQVPLCCESTEWCRMCGVSCARWIEVLCTAYVRRRGRWLALFWDLCCYRIVGLQECSEYMCLWSLGRGGVRYLGP